MFHKAVKYKFWLSLPRSDLSFVKKDVNFAAIIFLCQNLKCLIGKHLPKLIFEHTYVVRSFFIEKQHFTKNKMS